MILIIFSSVFIGLFLGFSNNILQLDAPTPWQIGFQDGASPGIEGIVTLHDSIMFYLIWILVSVFWVLMSLISYFSSNNSTLVYKYLNHGILMCPFQVFIIIFYIFLINSTKTNSNLFLKHSQFSYFNPFIAPSSLKNRPPIKLNKFSYPIRFYSNSAKNYESNGKDLLIKSNATSKPKFTLSVSDSTENFDNIKYKTCKILWKCLSIEKFNFKRK